MPASDANFKLSNTFNVELTDQSHLTANFSDSSYDADSYFWGFGDGKISTEQNPTHTYTDLGETKTYTANRVAIGKAGYRDFYYVLGD